MDDLAVGGELVGSRMDQDNQGWAVGQNLTLRWNYLHFDPVTLYIEGGAGFFEGDRDFPGHRGYRSNLTAGAIAGLAWRIAKNTYLIGAFRYFHLSNGHSSGNPSFDGIGGYGGVMFSF